ncbi:hypothetical protein J6590_027684 [Homalodisca vitripennis]|nr:hypothetical protein J6590_027684 [Homalodisca vitripennis]
MNKLDTFGVSEKGSLKNIEVTKSPVKDPVQGCHFLNYQIIRTHLDYDLEIRPDNPGDLRTWILQFQDQCITCSEAVTGTAVDWNAGPLPRVTRDQNQKHAQPETSIVTSSSSLTKRQAARPGRAGSEYNPHLVCRSDWAPQPSNRQQPESDPIPADNHDYTSQILPFVVSYTETIVVGDGPFEWSFLNLCTLMHPTNPMIFKRVFIHIPTIVVSYTETTVVGDGPFEWSLLNLCTLMHPTNPMIFKRVFIHCTVPIVPIIEMMLRVAVAALSKAVDFGSGCDQKVPGLFIYYGNAMSHSDAVVSIVFPDSTITQLCLQINHNITESNISTWFKRFKGGRTSIDDDARSGRPSTSINDDNVDQTVD